MFVIWTDIFIVEKAFNKCLQTAGADSHLGAIAKARAPRKQFLVKSMDIVSSVLGGTHRLERDILVP